MKWPWRKSEEPSKLTRYWNGYCVTEKTYQEYIRIQESEKLRNEKNGFFRLFWSWLQTERFYKEMGY